MPSDMTFTEGVRFVQQFLTRKGLGYRDLQITYLTAIDDDNENGSGPLEGFAITVTIDVADGASAELTATGETVAEACDNIVEATDKAVA